MADKYTSHIPNHSHFSLNLSLTYNFARKYIHKNIQRNSKQKIIECEKSLNIQYNNAINVVNIHNGVCNSYFHISYIIKNDNHRFIANRNHNCSKSEYGYIRYVATKTKPLITSIIQ